MFRKLLVITIGIAFLLAFSVAEAKKVEMTLRVNTNGFAEFDSVVAPTALAGAAFYIGGDICEELGIGDDCTPIGKFHCWGWLIGPDQAVGPVSQEYNLFDRGKILVLGLEDEGPRAVVGGTGEFRRVRGQATGFDLSQFMSDGEFTGTFELERVRQKSMKDD